MISRKKTFLPVVIISLLFPLNASINETGTNKINSVVLVNPAENTTESDNKIILAKKKKDKTDDKKALKRQKELLEKREKAEAEIAARKAAAEKEEQERLEAERLEAERLEAERLEAERLEKERIENEKLEAERLAKEKEEKELEEQKRLEEEKKLEQERIEKEKQEQAALEQKKQQELLQQQLELELAKQKEAVNKNRKEYLSDYMIYDLPTVDDSTADENAYYHINNPNETDASGRTLLMRAAKSGNEWELKQLLAAGADVNLTDNDGWTALMYAVRYSDALDCVDALLEAGADVTKKNKYNASALVLASCYNGNPKILTKLLDEYKSSDKEVLRSLIFLLSEQNISERQQLSKVELFMEKAVPLNVIYEGKTPLIYAAQYGSYTTVIQLLLDNQASVTLRSTEGKTAFDYAVKNKNLAHDETYWALNNR